MKIASIFFTLVIGFSNQVMVARILRMDPLTYFTYSIYEKLLGKKILQVQEETLEENRKFKSLLSPTVNERSMLAARFNMS